MTSELISKITRKSKGFKFESSRRYKSKGASTVPYKEYIVLYNLYPDFIFLVHENMCYQGESLVDSSYDVFSFDKQGNYLKKEDVEALDGEFFRDMKVVKII